MRVHQFEEEVPERPDLSAARHVDTLGAQGNSKGEVSAGQGEDCQREHFLDSKR